MACRSQSCDLGITNLGFDCVKIFGRAYKLLFQQKYDSLGALNYIPYDAVLDQDYFDDYINETDTSVRMYPTPQLTNPGGDRADAKYFTDDTGAESFLQDGARALTALIYKDGGSNSPQMQGKLEALRDVSQLAFYIITTEGQLVGIETSDAAGLRGIGCDSQSITALFKFLTAEQVQCIDFKMNWSLSEKDSELRMFDCSEVGDADLKALTGLKKICARFTGITQTGATMELYTEFGTPVNPILDKGVVTADLVSSETDTTSKVRNTTDGADLTVTVTETSTEGIYTLAWASQDIGDVIEVKIVRTGRDYTCVLENTVEIPAT